MTVPLQEKQQVNSFLQKATGSRQPSRRTEVFRLENSKPAEAGEAVENR
jgi:hypothetical protein